MEKLIKNPEGFLNENCSVCGKRLTKFGNKTLKDGLLCRNCAKMSSSWLSDDDFAQKSTHDMKKHLDYRRNNYLRLDDFVVSKTVEGKYKLYLDETNRQLYFSRKKDVKKENPDIVPFNDIKEISIVEQQYLDEDGVDLMFEMLVDNDQFNKMSFRINEFPGIDINSEEFVKTSKIADNYLKAIVEDIDMEEVL